MRYSGTDSPILSHKGTIKTGVSNNATTSNNVFQFHKGTIKTKQGHKAKK